MAAKKKKAAAGKGGDLLISKSRTKAAVKKCNVSGDFYSAFDAAARNLLKFAEERALANKRKTLRPQDL
jgi:histone H3/H4